ncbi:hypothetical protein GTQ99_00405 [Kineococcus sp. T13]|uniref:hypothetical protein n=1 Tax=Kineococcus vitellinus TaxID=2696565 RepID=UPI001411E1C6|nr:hypothetical protein [Kineococcus vitellinus]NAZ73892.1 hypothetical protein [Kineococcus vitellinus]
MSDPFVYAISYLNQFDELTIHGFYTLDVALDRCADMADASALTLHPFDFVEFAKPIRGEELQALIRDWRP